MLRKRKNQLDQQLLNRVDNEEPGNRSMKRKRILDSIELPPSEVEYNDRHSVESFSRHSQRQQLERTSRERNSPAPSLRRSVASERQRSVANHHRSMGSPDLLETTVSQQQHSFDREPSSGISEHDDQDSVYSEGNRSESVAGGEGFSFARSVGSSLKPSQKSTQTRANNKVLEWVPMDEAICKEIDRTLNKALEVAVTVLNDEGISPEKQINARPVVREYMKLVKKRIRRTPVPGIATAEMFNQERMENTVQKLEMETQSKINKLAKTERNALLEMRKLEDEEKAANEVEKTYKKNQEMLEKDQEQLVALDASWQAPAPKNDYIMNLWKYPSSKFSEA